MTYELAHRVKGKAIAVLGACGTVGQELTRQLAALEPASVIGLDQDEAGLFYLEIKYRQDPRFSFHLADIRDRPSLATRLRGIDLALHTAALKHVPLCEDAPLEAVRTNIVGTQNVLDAAKAAGVKRVLFTSTDKAVNPTSVMGTSKLMAERLVTACDDTEMVAMTTRFGNVLGSSGSVVPVFHQQIAAGGPVTVTDPEMTRFVMTLEQASALVLQSAFEGRAGDVMITKMPVVRIGDLAEVMIQELAPQYGHRPDDVDIEVIGTRPGEKLYEELMNEEEVRRSWDIGPFLVVEPALSNSVEPVGAVGRPDRPYNSHLENQLSSQKLQELLKINGLLSGTASV